MSPTAGKLADPEFRRERARKAAVARTSPDHHIQQVIDRAPALTDEQVERIRALLGLGRPVARGQEVGDAKAS